MSAESMKELLQQAVAEDEPIELHKLAVRLVMAALAGAAVAAIHRATRKPGPEGVPLVGTFVLLSVVIALVTVAIGGNLARAFGLVAALSIIRFRTAMDDTRDTAFVIFAVGVGMMTGTGYLAQAAIGIPIVGATAMLLAVWEKWAEPKGGGGGRLRLKVSNGHDPDVILADVIGAAGHVTRLVAAESCGKGEAMEYTYQVKWKGAPALGSLAAALNRCEGVKGVEIRPG